MPYKGGAQAINDLIEGQVQLMFANLPEVLQLIGNDYQTFQKYVGGDVPRWEILVRESGASVE